jgi:hypothetical protein
MHVLTGDSPLPDGVPGLPGPAAVVEAVPVGERLLGTIQSCGLTGLRLTKFGAAPCFHASGVEMRETMLEAFRPAETSDNTVNVVFKGPFQELVDDEGRVFRRGHRTRVPASVWAAIERGPIADQFVCLRESGKPD